jgi:ATP-dependent RNA helicase SUPV3L1/SUV3
LEELARRDDIRACIRNSEHVALLWDLCQIPDYRQLMLSHHANLVAEIFGHLVKPPGKLSAEFLRARLARLSQYDGDIEQLMSRMAFVRTWTYVTSHGSWAQQAAQIRQEAHDIEDRLSDALHQRLVERFVVVRKRSASASVKPEKSHPFWALEQLRDELFGQDTTPAGSSQEPLVVDADAKLRRGSSVVGQLVRGNDLLHPAVRVAPADAAGQDREALQGQLTTEIRAAVAGLLEPCRPEEAASPALSGLLYSLRWSLGCVERRAVAPQLSELGAEDHAELAGRSIAIGNRWVYLGRRLKPRHTALRAALWRAFEGDTTLVLPGSGATFLHAPPELSDAALLALSHPRVGAFGVRVDIAERLLALAHRQHALSAAQRLLGAKRSATQEVLDALRPRARRRGRRARRPSTNR